MGGFSFNSIQNEYLRSSVCGCLILVIVPYEIFKDFENFEHREVFRLMNLASGMTST